MEIWIDASVLAAAEPGAFIREREMEMHGALAGGWYDWLRANSPLPLAGDKAALRARAQELADRGESLPVSDPDD